MKEKILILGGSGFIGKNLVLRLGILKNYKITSVSRNLPIKKERIHNIDYIECNLTNPKNLKKFDNKNFDYIINLSGNINHKNKNITKKIHNIAAKNIFKYFSTKRFKLFIQVGSSLEYGKTASPQAEIFKCKPNSYYGKSKLSTSRFIERFGRKNKVKFLILRLYQIYGPYQKLDRLIPFTIDKCLKNKRFDCSEGEQLRDFLFIDDLVELFLLILRKLKIKSGIYNVGYGAPIKVKNVIKLIKNIIKKGKPKYGGIKMRSDEIEELFPDLKKISKTFKWKAKTSLSNGLKKTVKFYAKN